MDYGNEEREEILSNNKNEMAGSTFKSNNAVIHELPVRITETVFSIYTVLNQWCLIWGPWLALRTKP